MASGPGVRFRMFKAWHPRRLEEADVAHGVSRTLGRDGHVHQGRVAGGDGLSGEVGQDQGLAEGADRHAYEGATASATHVGNMGIPNVCRADVSLVEPLHEGDKSNY